MVVASRHIAAEKMACHPKLRRDSRAKGGGADRDRTDDLLNAIQALSQLSYGPTFGGNECEESGVRVRNSIEKVKPCRGSSVERTSTPWQGPLHITSP